MTKQEAVTQIMGGIYHITDTALLHRLEAHGEVRRFERGEVIQHSGTRVAEAMFVISGVIRAYFFSGKGEELTDCFLSDFGFSTIIPDAERLAFLQCEALTHVEVLVLPLSFVFKEIAQSEQFLKAYNHMLNWSILFHWQIKNSRICYNGTERYAWFRKRFPEAAKVAYGKDVASFLGLAPETLSRIRKAAVEVELFPIMVDMKTDSSSDDLLKSIAGGNGPKAPLQN